jgi:hypothetical protein
MGGGSDSRIPSILQEMSESLSEAVSVRVVARTYSFDPEIAAGQISSWMDELKPALVIGESLGALHALRLRGLPLIFVSPAVNAPLYLAPLAWLTLIPGVTRLLDRIYKPREGDRQPLHFTFRTLRKYRRHRIMALNGLPEDSGNDMFFAFFGRRDHYRRSGVVSIRTWRRHFGRDSYRIYDGTHFMEEDFVRTMLADKIREMLSVSR